MKGEVGVEFLFLKLCAIGGFFKSWKKKVEA